MTQVCIRCKVEKPLSDFHLRMKGNVLVKRRCKQCTLERLYELSLRAPGEKGDAR